MTEAPPALSEGVMDLIRQAVSADPRVLNQIGNEIETLRREQMEPPPETDVSVLDSMYQWPPLSVPGAELRWFQKVAIGWMFRRASVPWQGVRGGILCKEMGLGKTLDALTYAMMVPGVHLFVCHLSLLQSTMVHEARQWYGDRLPHVALHEDLIGTNQFNAFTGVGAKVVFATYDTVKMLARAAGVIDGRKTKADVARGPMAQRFFSLKFASVFADESQVLSSAKTKVHEAMGLLKSDVRWCLSGTPIRNSEMDLVAQLRWMGLDAPGRLKYADFERLQLRHCILEMTVAQCLPELPPLETHNVVLAFTEEEKWLYRLIVAQAKAKFAEYKSLKGQEKRKGRSAVMAMFLRLRKVCTAPTLVVSDAEVAMARQNPGAMMRGAIAAGQEVAAEQWLMNRSGTAGMGSTKINMVHEICARYPHDKVLVFSKFLEPLNLVSQRLIAAFPDQFPVVITGKTPLHERDTMIARFRADPACRFLLGSEVCTEGFTFTKANHVILLEPHENDMFKNQAIARIARMGQQKPMHVWSLTVRGSVEQRLVEICKRKSEASHKLMKELDSAALEAILNGL